MKDSSASIFPVYYPNREENTKAHQSQLGTKTLQADILHAVSYLKPGWLKTFKLSQHLSQSLQ